MSSVDSWRKQVSTSDGCRKLFNSHNFKSDLVECMIHLHESSLKALNNHAHFNSIINLYRTIRNLSSVPSQAEWIISESNLMLNINHYLNTVFLKLGQILSSPKSSDDEDESLVLLCDIIRAAFQILCNLSFHQFPSSKIQIQSQSDSESNSKSADSVNSMHSILWSQFTSFDDSNCLIHWVSDLHDLTQKQSKQITSDLFQSNMDRILEPICALLHQFIVHHQEIWSEKEVDDVMRAMFQIQMIDVKWFGNKKGYLYEKREAEDDGNGDNDDDESSSDDDDDDDDEEEQKEMSHQMVEKDEFDKWKHHEWIRKMMPYFINSNGLLFYIEKLTQSADPSDSGVCRLFYFGVSVELLFELTEVMLIDIKHEVPINGLNIPNEPKEENQKDLDLKKQKMMYLIQHSLLPTILKLFEIVQFAMKTVIPDVFKRRLEHSEDEMLIGICQMTLEMISNVALVSTSIKDIGERRQYQRGLLDHGGSVLVECLRMLQEEADQNNEYCKHNFMRMEEFNVKYENTMAKVLSYRIQILSTISTLCSGNKMAQDFMRENGVIELMLNMTKVDRSTMFLKEWAIFGIKNMTEGNAQNQQYIQSIKGQKVVQNEEMKKMGIEVSYDEISGTLKTKKINKE